MKKILLLDLDETLIHTDFVEPERFDFTLKIHNGIKFQKGWVSVRPHLDLFLKTVSSHYELWIWTAGTKQYADYVIDKIDKHKLIKKRLYRKDCLVRKTVSDKIIYIKDIKKLNLQPNSVFLIDNNINSAIKQPDLILLIKDFFGSPKDNQLILLTHYISQHHHKTPKQLCRFWNDTQTFLFTV